MIKRLTKRQIVLIILLILIIGAALAYALTRDKEIMNSDERKPSQLTGVLVAPDLAERPILAIIIENSPAARPQTGLDAAGIVFETTSEGGITRYMALYQEDMPEIAGPVRSLRPYFLDWAMGFDASIAHVGGSPEALEQAKDREAKSLNQFTYSEPYYRDNARTAPHNMYTRTQGLRDLQKELGHENSSFDDIPRKSDSPVQDPQVNTIVINFSSATYQSEFRYQPSDNNFVRHLAGDPHMDSATNRPVTVKNLVVIRTDKDDANKAIGEGEALVFMDGQVRTVQWENEGYENRVKLVDKDGKELALNRGDTWFAVLPENRQVKY